MPLDLPPTPSTTATMSFVACLLVAGASVIMFRSEPTVSTLLGAASVMLGAALLQRRRARRRQKPDGQPQPNDVYFQSHDWYEPDPADFGSVVDPGCARSCSRGCGGQTRSNPASAIAIAEARARLSPPDGSVGG